MSQNEKLFGETPMRNHKKRILIQTVEKENFIQRAAAPAHTSSLSSMVKNEIFIREECKSCSAKKCHFQSTNHSNSNAKSVKFKDYWLYICAQKLQYSTH